MIEIKKKNPIVSSLFDLNCFKNLSVVNMIVRWEIDKYGHILGVNSPN